MLCPAPDSHIPALSLHGILILPECSKHNSCHNSCKKDKNLENDWLIGDESWREGKNTYHIRLTYYSDDDAEKEGRESEYQYIIRFDEAEGYLIKSEGVPEKEYKLTNHN